MPDLGVCGGLHSALSPGGPSNQTGVIVRRRKSGWGCTTQTKPNRVGAAGAIPRGSDSPGGGKASNQTKPNQTNPNRGWCGGRTLHSRCYYRPVTAGGTLTTAQVATVSAADGTSRSTFSPLHASSSVSRSSSHDAGRRLPRTPAISDKSPFYAPGSSENGWPHCVSLDAVPAVR